MRRILLYLVISAVSMYSISQEIKPDRTFINNFYNAEAYMYENNYDEALRLLLKLEEIDPQNPNLWYKIGVCYLHTRAHKPKSEAYLEKCAEYVNPNYKPDNHRERSVPMEALLYLGQSYRLNHKFDLSIATFEDLASKLDPKKTKDANLLKEIPREIDLTNNAIYFTANPVNAEFYNLGASINTRFTEHSPIVDLNETTMYFTSRRPRDNEAYLNQDEDIFIAKKVNNVWQNAVRLGLPINTTEHNESAIGLTTDGKQLFFYRSGKDNSGNIYTATRLDNDGYEWEEPKLLREDINTKYRETHASISPDGNSIFFTSDRKGGVGKRDIYVMRKLPDETWSKPQLISDVVNTPYNEESPFIHPDGVTMFFSSEGHNSMGGYDVFYTTMDKRGNFTAPVNLGYPINTTDDDVSYIMNIDGRRGYIASAKDDSFGDLDIYEILQEGIYYNNLIVFDGLVSDLNNKVPEDVIISVRDVDTEEQIGIYRPDKRRGNYILILFPDRTYNITYEAAGHMIHSLKYTATTEDMNKYTKLYIPVELDPVVLQAFLMHDIVYFIDNETDLDPAAIEVLNKVINTLSEWQKEGPGLIININLPIIGGGQEKNKIRLEKITDYLIANNVDNSIIYQNGSFPQGYKDVYSLDVKETKSILADADLPITDRISTFKGDTVVIENILFDFDRFVIKSEYVAMLNKLADYMNENPNAQIEIGGHTDWIGSSEYNYLLSYHRAKTVKDYLVKRGNNPANIITTKFGEDKPIAENVTSTGRKYNRRAEFSVLAQGTEAFLKVRALNITTDGSSITLQPGDKWTVQIFALRKMKPVDYFADLVGVKLHVSDDGWYRYYVGEFTNRREAKQALDNLKSMGYEPFIRKLSFFENIED